MLIVLLLLELERLTLVVECAVHVFFHAFLLVFEEFHLLKVPLLELLKALSVHCGDKFFKFTALSLLCLFVAQALFL